MYLRPVCVFLLPVCLYAALISPAFLSSCKRSSPEEDITLPVTPPLSRPAIGYGVANSNYTRILDKQGNDGKSIGFLRKGQIVEVLERRPLLVNEKAEMWVRVSGVYSGWLKESELQVYSTMPQAVTASESISND
jgi:hypothetical protein